MWGTSVRIGLCVTVFGCSLFSYLETQNDLTQMKMRLPDLEKKLAFTREESKRLALQIDQFESPSHLIELAHKPEYSHLKHPLLKEILTVPEAIASN